jgi:hypothetical protein
VKTHEILVAIFSSLIPIAGVGVPDENSIVDLEPLSRELLNQSLLTGHTPSTFDTELLR